MAIWPSTLVITRQGFRETPPDNIMRSKMDVGPDKIRRRSTSAIRPISFNLFLNDAQLNTLDDFYVTTLMSGALEFDFIDLRSGDTVECRFTAAPSYSRNETMWDVAIALEILP